MIPLILFLALLMTGCSTAPSFTTPTLGVATATVQKKVQVQPKPKWPDTTPIDKTDPFWESNNNLNINGTPYHKVEVSPGKWQWKVDEESIASLQEMENERAKRFAGLSTRKLTHDELMRVNTDANVQSGQTYFAVDKYAELYDALVKQWELQKGRKMEGYHPLSTAKGEWNRSPQEGDSRRAVEDMIQQLQKMTEPKMTDVVCIGDACEVDWPKGPEDICYCTPGATGFCGTKKIPCYVCRRNDPDPVCRTLDAEMKKKEKP